MKGAPSFTYLIWAGTEQIFNQPYDRNTTKRSQERPFDTVLVFLIHQNERNCIKAAMRAFRGNGCILYVQSWEVTQDLLHDNILWKFIFLIFYSSIDKYMAEGTYWQEKSKYSSHHLYPSVSICLDIGAAKMLAKMQIYQHIYVSGDTLGSKVKVRIIFSSIKKQNIWRLENNQSSPPDVCWSCQKCAAHRRISSRNFPHHRKRVREQDIQRPKASD